MRYAYANASSMSMPKNNEGEIAENVPVSIAANYDFEVNNV